MPARLVRLSRFVGRALFLLAHLWAVGAIWFSGVGPGWISATLAVVFAGAFPVAWFARHPNRRRTVLVFAACVALLLIAWQFKRPSNDRDWTPDMVRPARITIDGDRVAIADVRDCRYRSTEDYDVRHVDRTFDLGALRSIDFMVERFHAYDFLAHTLLTFGFDDGARVVISIELRKETGESFDPIAGLFKQYELMYVVGTEQDLIGLRTNHRRSRVWLYPIQTTPERMRALFLDMLERARTLAGKPEFYNSLTSSCTTNIADHVRVLVPGRIPLDWRILFPGYAGELAHELDLIDTDLPFDEAEDRFRIDLTAQEQPIGDDFSQRIRSGR